MYIKSPISNPQSPIYNLILNSFPIVSESEKNDEHLNASQANSHIANIDTSILISEIVHILESNSSQLANLRELHQQLVHAPKLSAFQRHGTF